MYNYVNAIESKAKYPSYNHEILAAMDGLWVDHQAEFDGIANTH